MGEILLTILPLRTWPDRIIHLRDTMRLTQAQFARRIGLADKSSVSQYESGRRVVPERVRKLVMALEKDTFKIVQNTENI